MYDLVTRSLDVIKAGQTASGAYVACPEYPTYRYCWFRDGAFIAHAMDLWGEHASARRFYDWVAQTVLNRTEAVERCVAAVNRGERLDPLDLLDTRYTADGRRGDDAEWPNFQLDGFGTVLWGLRRHSALTGQPAPPAWDEAARLVARYLAALWPYPNYDCWEEFPDRIAVSTLAAVYAGLHAASTLLGSDDGEGRRATATIAAIEERVRRDGVRDGHLIKQLDGEDTVDASLLWACIPFGDHSLLRPNDPLMRGTVERIEADLIGKAGGVHRYRADTFYGGGEWVLLTALLGEYRAATGDATGARACHAFIEAQADVWGRLPEQTTAASFHPSRVGEWVDRWGPVACPLLWSHASYLSLMRIAGPNVAKVEISAR